MTDRDPRTAAWTHISGDYDDLVEREMRRLRELRKTCDHSGYNFAKDGRCCPACGTFMVDFGND